MFGIKQLRQRIELLENTVKDLRQDKLCAAGNHVWEAKDLTYNKPLIRCAHCHERPEGN